MNRLGKGVLLALCGSLFIVIIAVFWSKSDRSTPRATQWSLEYLREHVSFVYTRPRSYVDALSEYCTSDRPDQQAEWRKEFVCESKITDAVIAFLTFFLMIFTGLLVWVGRKQERTTRQQMRAFVYLHGGAVYNVASPLAPLAIYKPTGAEIISPGEGPLAQLTIRNSGSTPAYNVVHWGSICVADFPLKEQLPKQVKTKIAPSSAIPPDGLNTKNVRIPQSLTSEQIAGLRNGTAALWVYGEITYRDAFRRKRRSKYRLFHNNASGAIGVSTELTWAEGGNEAS